jgi:hypothetical protein
VAEDRCELLCLDLPRAEAIRKRLRPAVAEHAAARAKALADPTRLSSLITCGPCVPLAWLARGASTRSSSMRSPISAAGCSTRSSTSPSYRDEHAVA